MKLRYLFFIYGVLFCSCAKNAEIKSKVKEENKFNQALADELSRMVKVDQIAAYIPQGKYEKYSEAEWNAFKDSVFTTHQDKLESILDKYGFAGYDLVGEEGSKNFWLMVQHSDHKPQFQQEVLDKMKTEVKVQNASPSNYAYLYDRVTLNMGKEQLYGTQVSYNTEICQAYVENLGDSLMVNKRRKEIGLESLENYLNSMVESHFMMNKEYYLKEGIKSPKLYKISD